MLFLAHTHSIFMMNASWLGPLPKWDEQPCARVMPSCKLAVNAFVKAQHHCEVQPRFGDFTMK